MGVNHLKQILSIKLKPRDDNLFDQYSRIFMVKILLVCCFVCGMSWYGDVFYCHLPNGAVNAESFSRFVGTSCWTQGVYIYRALRSRNDDVAYFGITMDIDQDGMLKGTSELCKTQSRFGEVNKACTPLEKTFFLQYQYLPFLMGGLTMLYYLPYMAFKSVNDDIVKLQMKIQRNAKAVDILRLFFKKRNRMLLFDTQLSSRHLQILLVKVFYVVVNVAVLFCLDSILEGYFVGFGRRWINWYKQNNTMRFDCMGSREFPKPANQVLPPFGYCEVYSSDREATQSNFNHLKVVCEVSQHVLYQYALVLLWFCIVAGIVISTIGFVVALGKILCGCLGLRKFGEKEEIQKIYSCVTNREIDYLEVIKDRDVGLYEEVVALLTSSCEECEEVLSSEQCTDSRMTECPLNAYDCSKPTEQPSDAYNTSRSTEQLSYEYVVPWTEEEQPNERYHIGRAVIVESLYGDQLANACLLTTYISK